MLKFLYFQLATIFFVCCVAHDATAEETKPNVMPSVLSSFDLPLNDLRERPDGGFFNRLFDGFSGNFAIGIPLDLSQDGITSGDGFRDRIGNTPTLKATVKYNPVGAWFAAGTYYYYGNGDLQQDWNPDFSYVFGYDDWRPYTFSLVYSNYGGNRIRPNRLDGEELTEFDEGTISLGWKFPVPKKIANSMLIDKSGAIGCIISYHASPKYFDLDTLSQNSWKQAASLGCKYTIKNNWYINWTAFLYPHKNQKQPWDPDFTYGFGYFDWRAGKIMLQYNNYSGNRFPWSKTKAGGGSFLDGEVSLGWSWSF